MLNEGNTIPGKSLRETTVPFFKSTTRVSFSAFIKVKPVIASRVGVVGLFGTGAAGVVAGVGGEATGATTGTTIEGLGATTGAAGVVGAVTGAAAGALGVPIGASAGQAMVKVAVNGDPAEPCPPLCGYGTAVTEWAPHPNRRHAE
jgi:hypothetical protein